MKPVILPQTKNVKKNRAPRNAVHPFGKSPLQTKHEEQAPSVTIPKKSINPTIQQIHVRENKKSHPPGVASIIIGPRVRLLRQPVFSSPWPRPFSV
jgi:hypothetical protein